MKHVSKMSKRELELVVKNFLKSKLTSADRVGISSNQDKESPKTGVESDFEALRDAMDRAVASIKGVDSDSRNSWISELEELCQTRLEQLTETSN